jgi:hypothetical protein
MPKLRSQYPPHCPGGSEHLLLSEMPEELSAGDGLQHFVTVVSKPECRRTQTGIKPKKLKRFGNEVATGNSISALGSHHFLTVPRNRLTLTNATCTLRVLWVPE